MFLRLLVDRMMLCSFLVANSIATVIRRASVEKLLVEHECVRYLFVSLAGDVPAKRLWLSVTLMTQVCTLFFRRSFSDDLSW